MGRMQLYAVASNSQIPVYSHTILTDSTHKNVVCDGMARGKLCSYTDFAYMRSAHATNIFCCCYKLIRSTFTRTHVHGLDMEHVANLKVIQSKYPTIQPNLQLLAKHNCVWRKIWIEIETTTHAYFVHSQIQSHHAHIDLHTNSRTFDLIRSMCALLFVAKSF